MLYFTPLMSHITYLEESFFKNGHREKPDFDFVAIDSISKNLDVLKTYIVALQFSSLYRVQFKSFKPDFYIRSD